MHRDLSIFPADDDGDILWDMQVAGDDLAAPRSVNFSVLFESEANAELFAAEMREAAFDVQVDECLDTYDSPVWDAVVTMYIAPSHERISALSDLISSMATDHSGFLDSWAAARSPNSSLKAKPLRGST